MLKIVLVGLLLVAASCDYRRGEDTTDAPSTSPSQPETNSEGDDSDDESESQEGDLGGEGDKFKGEGKGDFEDPEGPDLNKFEVPSDDEDVADQDKNEGPKSPTPDEFAIPKDKPEPEPMPNAEDLEQELRQQLIKQEQDITPVQKTWGEYLYSFWSALPNLNVFTSYVAKVPNDIMAFADDEQQTADFKDYFLKHMQAPLVQLGMRDSFNDRVLTPILFPRSTALYWSLKASKKGYNYLAEKEFVPEDYSVSIATEIACLGTKWYQGAHFRITDHNELLKEWSKTELANGSGLAQKTMSAAKSLDESLLTAQSFLSFKQKFNVAKNKFNQIKKTAAGKITFSMNDTSAKKEAEIWLEAFGSTISSVMDADKKEHGDGLALFLELSANLLNSCLRESLIERVLIPTIKQANLTINQAYTKKVVVDEGLGFAVDLLKSPILDIVQANHPELIAYLNSIYSQLPSKQAIDDAEQLRSLLMWKTIQVRVFEYISSFIYLADAVYVEKADGYDIRFDRIIKAHVTRHLRTDELSAIDIALDNLKTLMGGKDELFFSGLATIEFVRNGSVLAKKYPVLNDPINILYDKIYGLKVSAKEWWALPPDEMGILMNYAIKNAFDTAKFADFSNSKVGVNFIAQAAKNSRITQIQFKNMAMAAGVGAAKVGLSAYVSSPLATFFVGLVEAGKLAGASQSGKVGGAGLSFILNQADADKKVSVGTQRCITFIRTFIATVNSGFDNVPTDFYSAKVSDT